MRRIAKLPWPYLVVAASILWFAATAGHRIALPGLDYDELTFVNAASGGAGDMFVSKRLLGVPVMVMEYYGALKAYLYAPVFALFGASAATIRWPVVLVSCVSLVLIYAIGRLGAGARAAAALTVLAAMDPVFTWMTKLDFGPTALMTVLKLGALYCFYRALITRSLASLWGAVLLCALGVFDKLNFIWIVIALGIVSVTLFRRELAAMYRRHGLMFVGPIAALGAAMAAAAAFLVLPQFLTTQRTTDSVGTLARIPHLVTRYSRTMNGRELYAWITGTALRHFTIVNALGVAAVVVLLGSWLVRAWRRRALGSRALRLSLRERIVASWLVLFVVIALQILVTKRAGGPHHLMLLHPFHLMLVVAATAVVVRWRTGADRRSRIVARSVAAAALAALAALAASELLVAHDYASAFESETRVAPRWSPLIYELADYLNRQDADRIAYADWGLGNQMLALGTKPTRAASRDVWLEFRSSSTPAHERALLGDVFRGRRVLVVLHGPGIEMMPGAPANFLAWARARGLVLRPERTFVDRAGRVLYVVYAVSESPITTGR
jgi:hypothetical protein